MEENTELETLKEKATGLGIKFSANIGVAKLQEKIDEATAAEVEVETVEEVKPAVAEVVTPKVTPAQALKKAAIKNRKPIIVKITMVDKVEASTAQSYYFGTGDTSIKVPLDVWAEVPWILVDMAEKAITTIHMETPEGSVRKPTKKFVVEYKNPEDRIR